MLNEAVSYSTPPTFPTSSPAIWYEYKIVSFFSLEQEEGGEDWSLRQHHLSILVSATTLLPLYLPVKSLLNLVQLVLLVYLVTWYTLYNSYECTRCTHNTPSKLVGIHLVHLVPMIPTTPSNLLLFNPAAKYILGTFHFFTLKKLASLEATLVGNYPPSVEQLAWLGYAFKKRKKITLSWYCEPWN